MEKRGRRGKKHTFCSDVPLMVPLMFEVEEKTMLS